MLTFLFFLPLLSLCTSSIIGIDLGTEQIKTSIITPGRKLEIVESPHSKRSLPNTIGFSPSRLYGEDAVMQMSKDPTSVIELNQRAIGAYFNATQRLKKEYVMGNMVENQRGGISYDVKGTIFSSEEVFAMQLEFLKSLVGKTSGEIDCVLAVPAFYTQNQRKSVIAVAESVKFNVVALVPSNTAAALYYAMDRFDSSPLYVIIYNLGASYIEASLVKYSTTKNRLSVLSDKKNEFVEVLSHSWNENLGGRSIDTYIADFIAEKFKEEHGEDPRSQEKAKVRLVQEANKVKKMLSANKSVKSTLLALAYGLDCEVTVERTLIDGFVRQNSEEFLRPIREVLEKTGKNITDIGFIEIIGGVSRVPSVQQLISENFIEVSSHLNGDEAIANGAALFGANFSSEVHVRKVWMNDNFPFSVKAEIKSLKSGQIKAKELFPPKSLLGTSKKIALSSGEDLEIIVSVKYNEEFTQINKYQVSDIEIFSEKYAQIPSVVLSFTIDSSGIVKLVSAEARAEVEIEYLEDVKKEKDKKKIKNEKESTESESEKEKEITESKSENTESEKEISENPGSEKEITGNPESEKEISEKSEPENKSTESDKAEVEEEEEKPKKVLVTKKKMHKFELSVLETALEQPPVISKSDADLIKSTLKRFDSFETEQKLRIELKNDLESYIYDVKDKLEGPEFQKVLSPLDKETLISLLSSTMSWLEGLKSAVSSSSFTEAKEKIVKIVNPALRREKDYMAREEAILDAYLKLKSLYSDMSYLNKTKTWIDPDIKNEVFVYINETIAWIDEKVLEQSQIPDWELPVLKLTSLEAKVNGVEKKVEVIRSTPRPKKGEL